MVDVIIIGAGPAGTAAAWDLLDAGFTVLILDKTNFPRKKACAGGITPKALNLFRYDVSSVIKQACHRVKITDKNGTWFHIKNKAPLCYMTRREELDYFSLKKIVQKGGRFKVATRIRGITATAAGVTVLTNIGSFQSTYLIGADGSNSRVRRLTQPDRFWHHQMALEADIYVERPDQFDMEFDFCRFTNGYQWIFPKEDHVNVGFYAIGNKASMKASLLTDFVNHKIGPLPLEALKGYPICTGGYRYQPADNRILLIGDAAGLAEKLFGEGIYFAIKSGQLAADAIIKGTVNPTVSAARLYSHSLKSLRKDLQIYDMSAAWFYRFQKLSLKLLSYPRIHLRFSDGFAQGKTISQIFLGR